MKLVTLTIGLLGIALQGLAIKILGKKEESLAGHLLLSQNPFLIKKVKLCGFCGKQPDEQDCKKSYCRLKSIIFSLYYSKI